MGDEHADEEARETPFVVRFAEGLADARARLSMLESARASWEQHTETWRGATEEHLDRQDAALRELRSTLDALVAQAQRETQQRARMAAEQKRAREVASTGHRETIASISANAVAMGLALCATLLGLLAASWSPRQRSIIFAAALLLVVLILVAQWWSSRPPRGMT